MANFSSNKGFGGLMSFLLNKKNLPLLLLLLGGGATVVTGTVLLSTPGSNGSESSLSSGGSQTTSTSESSSEAFSGNEVPEWDLTNPTLSGEGANFGVGYDFTFNTRYQNDYLYQTGRNLFENAPSQDSRFSDYGFSIFNIRTATVEFQFAFNPGQTYINYIINNVDSYNYWGNLRFAYDGESSIYVMITTPLQSDLEEIDSRLQGNYQPMVDFALSLGTPLDEQHEFFLKFDIADNTTYEVIDGRYSAMSGGMSDTNDLLFENGILYLAAGFNKFAIDNPSSVQENSLFDFLPIPEGYPTFTTLAGNVEFSYLFSLNITNIDEIILLSTTPITFDNNGWIYFSGYRKGFETRYFNDEGSLAIQISSWLYFNNNTAIEDYFNGLEQNFLSETDRDELYSFGEAKLSEFATRNNDELAQSITTSFNFTAYGFYNFDTNLLENPLFNAWSWYTQNLNGTMTELNNSFYQSYVIMESGDVYIITNEIFAVFVRENDFYGGFSSYNPDHLRYAYSSLESVDLTTKTKTMIEENDYNGKSISGIYEKEGGFYITGTYYETETSTDVQSADAYLMKVDASFNEVAELVLSGSKDEQGGSIVLNAQARPVWIVYSNSIDGDFESFAASNPNGTFKPYLVSF